MPSSSSELDVDPGAGPGLEYIATLRLGRDEPATRFWCRLADSAGNGEVRAAGDAGAGGILSLSCPRVNLWDELGVCCWLGLG